MALSVQEMQYSCDWCEYSCKGLAKLMAHTMMAHPGVCFQCGSCDLKFYSAQMLEEHEKTHAQDGPFECDSCGQCFERESHMKDHVGCQSRSRKRFGCDLCDFGCNSPQRYKAHMLIHQMEMGLGSNDSDSGGVNGAGDSHTAAGEVEAHQKVSTRLERYGCDFCDGTFVHSSQLKTHMKTHSTGSKPASDLDALDLDASKPHHYVGDCWFTVDDEEVDLKTNTGEKPHRGNSGPHTKATKPTSDSGASDSAVSGDDVGDCWSTFDDEEVDLGANTGENNTGGWIWGADPGARTKATNPTSDSGASDPASSCGDIGDSWSTADDEELDLETHIEYNSSDSGTPVAHKTAMKPSSDSGSIAQKPHRSDSGSAIAHTNAMKPTSDSGAYDATDSADEAGEFCTAVDDEEFDLETLIESNSGDSGTPVAHTTAMKPSSDSGASGPLDSGDFWTTIVKDGEDLKIHAKEKLPGSQSGATIAHTKTTKPSSDMGSLDGADLGDDGGYYCTTVVEDEEDLETHFEENLGDSGATVAHPIVTKPVSDVDALDAADPGYGWTTVVEEKFIDVELKIHVRKKPPRGSSGAAVTRTKSMKPTCVVPSDRSGSDSGEPRRRAPIASNTSSFGVVQRQTLMRVKPFKSDLGANTSTSETKVQQWAPGLFKCGLCQFSSVDCRLLQVHMSNRHVVIPSKCEICDRWFPNDNMLKAHEGTHEKVEEPECGSANLGSANLNPDDFADTSGDVHQTTVEGAHLCDLCGYTCDVAVQLKAHMMTHSDKDKPEDNDSLDHTDYTASKSAKRLTNKTKKIGLTKSYQCDICDRPFDHLGHFKAHLRSHSGVKPFKCEECDSRFSTKSHFNSHIMIHTGEKPHKCSFCDRSFRSPQHLKEHLRTHTGEKPYKCDECGKRFSQSGHLSAHKKIHAGLKTHKCGFCSYATYSASILKTHLRSHTGEKPYVCDICSFACKTKSVLNSHRRTHTGERPFQCDRCGYACAQAGYMKIHMRSHTGEKPYKCDLCEYTTSRKETLTVHKRTHTGEKPYKCDVCGYECSTSGHIAVHRRTHTGEKPYECLACSRRFNQHSQLKTHLRIHTGEKPYTCDSCDYVCSTAGSLKVHKRTHTGDNPFKCDTCSARFTTIGRLKSHLKIHSKKKNKSAFDSDSNSGDTDSSSDSGDSDSGDSSDD